MILLIVNPVAGRQRGKTSLGSIIEVCSADGLDVNVRFTMARGDAKALARSAKGKCTTRSYALAEPAL